MLVLCLRPVGGPGDSLDLEVARAALDAVYHPVVRTVLAALPGMRERGRGQVIAASVAAPEAGAGDRAAAAAAQAFLRIVAAEAAGDGVVVTQVHLPADPERAARRVCEAVALRPRVAPVRALPPL